jgi:hypothetical protein
MNNWLKGWGGVWGEILTSSLTLTEWISYDWVGDWNDSKKKLKRDDNGTANWHLNPINEKTLLLSNSSLSYKRSRNYYGLEAKLSYCAAVCRKTSKLFDGRETFISRKQQKLTGSWIIESLAANKNICPFVRVPKWSNRCVLPFLP